MRYKLRVKSMISVLLSVILITMVMLPVTSFAEPAVISSAYGYVRYKPITLNLDSGTFSETESNVTDTQNWTLTGGKTITSEIEAGMDDYVCSIEEQGFDTLAAALAAIGSGEAKTITLNNNITQNSGIVIDGRTVIFDLAGYTLEILPPWGTGLEVKNGGKLQLLDDSGALHVETTYPGSWGVHVSGNGSEATVTSITGAIYGAYAANNGSITVFEDCIAIDKIANECGARAVSGGSITVGGNAVSSLYGAYAQDLNSRIVIHGDAIGNYYATACGVSAIYHATVIVGKDAKGKFAGVSAGYDSEVTIDGTVSTFDESDIYVHVGGVNKTIDDYEAITTKVGYRTYRGTTANPAFVWVKDISPADGVCEIDGVMYDTLDKAMEEAGEGQITTIKLLQDIDYEGCMEISNKNIIFELGSFNLTVDNIDSEGSGAGLEVGNGGSVSYTGTGIFSVSGTHYGVKVSGEGSSAFVTCVSVVNSDVDEETMGVYTEEGGSATVNGDVNVIGNSAMGVRAENGGLLTVNGKITVTAGDDDGGNLVGAYAEGEESAIIVNGSITVEGDNIWGVLVCYAGNITVNTQTGESVTVTGFDACAVDARSAKATVNRGVSATGEYACGAAAGESGEVTVGGVTVQGNEARGVDTYGFGQVTVNGDIYANGEESYGVWARKGEAEGGTATVNGDVTSDGENSIGVKISNADHSSSTVTINGSVKGILFGLDINHGFVHVSGNVESENCGASLNNGEIIIDGEMISPTYLCLNESYRDMDSRNDTDDNGYWIYEGDNDCVVKVGQRKNDLPIVTTYQVLEAYIDSTGVKLRGSVTSEGSSPVISYGFAYRNDANNYTIGGVGSAAEFTADLDGLTPGTTYHVRAFATNSTGTAYGQEYSFITLAADPPGVPANLSYLAYDGAMELFWETPDDGGSPILYYEILRGSDLNAPWIDAGNTTTYMVAGLENGLYYEFHVRAVSAAGHGEAGTISGQPNIPTVPGPPRDMSTHASSHQVKVYWREPWSDGYRAVTGYQVSLDNSNWTDTDYPNAHTFTGLTNDVTYTFWVRAVNAIGTGEAACIQDAPMSHSGGAGAPTLPASPPPSPPPKAEVLDSKGNISSTSTANLNKNTGIVDVEVDSASLTGAFNVSEADSKGVKSIEVVIPEINEAKTYEVTLPADAFSAGDSSKVVEIKTELASVTLPDNMLPEDFASGVEKIALTVAVGDKNMLDPAVQEQVGDRPVIKLGLALDGRQISWNNENAPVTVTIPYTPTGAELESPESIIIWYIDDSGNGVCIPNGHYDPVTGSVTFTITHFSCYAVGYNKVSFKDVFESLWYSKAVSFIAARGIKADTDDGKYSPDAKLTRGDYLVLIMRAYGIAPDKNPEDSFSDAGNTYYTGYLAAAKRLGISTGVGNNRFAPGKEITRQEMFTMLYNILKSVGRLPQGNSGRVLSAFADAGQISSWAKEAMALLVETGVIDGNNGKLYPISVMTRAETAQELYNLMVKGK